jgi:ferrous iron transport protein A
MTLRQAVEGKEYTVCEIRTDDEEMDAFLFSLGCYAGEPITVVTHLRGGCIVSIKDARYTVDLPLADAITIEDRSA